MTPTWVLREIQEVKAKNSRILFLRAGRNEEELREFPMEVLQLKHLQRLSLCFHRRLRHIPPEIAQLEELQSLMVLGSQLTEISEGIQNLPKLQELKLKGNRIRQLPEDWQPNLTTLELGGNPLNSLTHGIFQLKHLRRLDLLGCRLQRLPPDISLLRNRRALEHHLRQRGHSP